MHDTRVARVWRIVERIEAANLTGLGDKGYAGLADVVFCPFKGRGKLQWKENAHSRLRSPGERAIAQLKQWDILRRLRCCPQRAGQITRAVLDLQLREAG